MGGTGGNEGGRGKGGGLTPDSTSLNPIYKFNLKNNYEIWWRPQRGVGLHKKGGKKVGSGRKWKSTQTLKSVTGLRSAVWGTKIIDRPVRFGVKQGKGGTAGLGKWVDTFAVNKVVVLIRWR